MKEVTKTKTNADGTDNDAEAVAYAAKMDYESETYPVVYFGSDTTGEKAYEEFYVPGEKM